MIGFKANRKDLGADVSDLKQRRAFVGDFAQKKSHFDTRLIFAFKCDITHPGMYLNISLINFLSFA